MRQVSPQIRAHIEKDLFARALGIALVELREGYAKCAMTVRDDQTNFHGTAHGGAIFTLADAAFAAACNAYGQTAVALEMNISFLSAVAPGARLVAEAHEEAPGARIALYHLTVTDERGALIASLHATAYRKHTRFVE